MLALTAAGGLALSLVACAPSSGTDGAPGDCSVGISMPTRSLERWINDGEGLKTKLEAVGCTADLQYAADRTDQQISQIQNQIAGGASILVVAAIDGLTLGPVLAEAKAAGATIIAYDRLINETENVDYYATFDNEQVGTLQGNYIVDTLGLANGAGPFNLEPFAGSPDDNNARFFFSGAWDVLLPYVTNGQLVVPSGKSPANNDDWASIGILGWTSAAAQAEMDNRLSSFYAGSSRVNVVLSPNDSLALGIEASLSAAGYTDGANWPLVTGQDADRANVEAILAGKQSMTVWKDTRALGDRVIEMVVSIKDGTTVEVNDSTTYNNGVKDVPSYLLTPEVVVQADVQTKLIDSGFLTAADIGL